MADEASEFYRLMTGLNAGRRKDGGHVYLIQRGGMSRRHLIVGISIVVVDHDQIKNVTLNVANALSLKYDQERNSLILSGRRAEDVIRQLSLKLFERPDALSSEWL